MGVPVNRIAVERLFAHCKAALKNPVRYLKTYIAAHRTTNFSRWSEASNLSSDWDERTIYMASLIPGGASVIEFGVGRLTLPKHLRPACVYQPVDLVARTPDTIVFDLNQIPYPTLPRHYDFAVFSGVLEYVEDLPALFRWLPSVADNVIFSYAVTDWLSDPTTRRENGWINDFSDRDLRACVDSVGMRLVLENRWREQKIYVSVTSAGGHQRAPASS